MTFDIKKLKKGLSNYYIYQLQRLLKNEAGFIIADPVGKFGGSTEKAIKKLQKDNQLQPTGKINTKTLEVVKRLFERTDSRDTLAFALKGKITDKNTGDPLTGFIVEVWDYDDSKSELIGRDTTDLKGKYKIEFDESDYMNKPSDFLPDLYFIIRNPNGQEVHTTKEKIKKDLEPGTYVENIPVDPNVEPIPQNFVVRGKVIDRVRKPQKNLVVKAYDKTLDDEKEIGKNKTKVDGTYEISYTDKDLSDGKKQPDLIVKVFKTARGNEALFTGPLILQALPAEVVNIVLGIKEKEPFVATSEYELFAKRLTPELEQVSADALLNSRKDLAYLAKNTGLDTDKLVHFLQAKSLSTRTGIDADVFYGLFRQDIPASLAGILSRDRNSYRDALKAAQENNVVSERPESEAELNKLFVELATKVAEHRFDKVDPEQRREIFSILVDRGLDEDEQKKFYSKYTLYKDDSEKFWNAIKSDLGESRMQKVQFSFQMGFFTLNNAPLVKKLGEFRQVKRPRDLASVSQNKWLKIIDQANLPKGIAGDTDAQKKDNFAKIIRHRVEGAFPTAVLNRELTDKEQQSPEDKQLLKFFKDNPDFEFRSIQLRTYLKKNANAFQGISARQREDFRKQLFARKRVFDLIPGAMPDKFKVFDALWQEKLTSAAGITRAGWNFFYQKVGAVIGAANSEKVFAQATKRHRQTLMLLSRYSTQMTNLPIHVIPRVEMPKTSGDSVAITLLRDAGPEERVFLTSMMTDSAVAGGPLEGLANLQELFGSLDYCKCRHCRSVLSPAAYFIDLLTFLESIVTPDDDTAKVKLLGEIDPAATVKGRRPDLKNIKLTCENTNTPMPYIDLVNEILEIIVAGDTITIEPADYQTTLPEAELRAMPEHVKLEAYEKLYAGTVVHPWILPFKLWWEEAQVYLNHLGVPRHEIMRYFHNPGSPPNLDPPAYIATYDIAQIRRAQADYLQAIAVEYLGITPLEWKIITDSDGRSIEEHYGINASELSSLKNVEKLLQQAQLDKDRQKAYDALQELLQSKFINPYHVKIDASCALDEASLDLDEKALKRLCRFRRLQKRLGWSVVELDKAIAALGSAPENFIQFSYVKRLLALFKVKLPEMLAWWAPIDTAGRIDDDSENTAPHFYIDTKTKKLIPSLYEKLFLNQTTNNPMLLDLFRLKDDASELKITTNDFLSDDITAPVLAGVGLSGDDLKFLLEKSVIDTGKVTLANLSQAYRVTIFCKALKISVREFVALKKMYGKPIIGLDSKPQDTFEFWETFQKIKKSSFEIDELNYLLRHDFPAKSSLPPEDKATAIFFEELKKELNQVFTEDQSETGEIDEVFEVKGGLERKLFYLLLLEPAQVISLLAIIRKTSGDSEAAQIAFLDGIGSIFSDVELIKSALLISSLTVIDDIDKRSTFVESLLKADLILLKHKLAYLLDKPAIDEIMSIIEKTSALSETEQKDFLDGNEAIFSDVDQAKNILLASSTGFEGNIDQRITLIQELLEIGKIAFLKSQLIKLLANGESLVRRLIENAMAIVEGNSQKSSALQKAFLELHLPVIGLSSAEVLDLQDKVVISTGPGYIGDNDTRREYLLDKLPKKPENGTNAEIRKQLITALSVSFRHQNIWVDNLIERFVLIVVKKSPLSVQQQEHLIDDFFDLFVDVEDAKAKLVAAGSSISEVDLRLDYIIKVLLFGNLIIQRFSEYLEVEVEATSLLLNRYLANPHNSTQKAISVYQDVGNFLKPDEEILRETYQDQFDTYERIYKAALVLGKFKSQADDLSFIFNQGPTPTIGWINLADLPIYPIDSPATLESFLRLAETFQLQNNLFPTQFSIFQFLLHCRQQKGTDSDPVTDDIIDELQAITNWDEEDLKFLVSKAFKFLIKDSKDERWLAKLAKAFEIQHRLGIVAQQIWQWNVVGVEKEQAQAIRNAAKAKHEQKTWLEIAPPLRDVLRNRQRDALQAYIIANIEPPPEFDFSFNDSKDIYSYYLIDTEMDACMMTSRIKQANASLQLFMQRMLLGLEVVDDGTGTLVPIEVSTDKAREWKWRKMYRVWEANRKVFLYPENWIEPELRLDKSPFFEELENELLQDEVDESTAEQVFHNYLRRLDEVSRLEISGFYIDEEQDIVHVIGRTYSIPHTYYYRRWMKYAYWTPWEKVEVDIEGNHLVPVVYNRRLYLFWPIFTEKTRKKDIGLRQRKLEKKIDEFQEMQDMLEQNSPGLHVEVESNGHFTATRIGAAPNIQFDDEIIAFMVENNFSGYDGELKIFVEEELEKSMPELEELKKLNHFWEIKIAWSEYKDGNWSAKKVSIDAIDTKDLRWQSIAKSLLYMWATTSRGELVISIDRDFLDWVEHFFPGRYEYFDRGDFKFDGCTMKPVAGNFQSSLLMKAPQLKMVPYFNSYLWPEEDPRSPQLQLHIDNDVLQVGTFLDKVEKGSRISFPHQVPFFKAEHPFFFEDRRRTFCAIPCTKRAMVWQGGFGSIGQVSYFDPDDLELYEPPDPIQGPPVIDFEQPGRVLDEELGNGLSPETVGYFTSASSRFMIMRNSSDTTLNGDAGMPSLVPLENLAATAMANDVFYLPGYGGYYKIEEEKVFKFVNFYHPYVCLFIKQLNRYGIDGLLNPKVQAGITDNDSEDLKRQLTPNSDFDYFEAAYQPTDSILKPYPIEDIDFEHSSPYSHYNWELFFHAPFLVATQLSQNQKFEEAQKWFHYIFDPTESEGEAPRRFWKIKPFFEFDGVKHIKELLDILSGTDDNAKRNLVNQVIAWQDNPFQPHLIASFRIIAYMRTVVMKYLDNLIAWADQRFRRFTIESINEATQLYILAAEILGKRPVMVDEKKKDVETAEAVFDDLMDDLETEIGELSGSCFGDYVPDDGDADFSALDSLFSNYFCIPNNPRLLDYWDTVADRLFKIRHCMDIEGIVRQLPLFEPPIDPAILVRAVAAGVDLSSAINDLYAPLPHYRFTYMLQKAVELCNDVKALGGALLSALEKKDAEELSRIRASHEVSLQKAVKEIRKKAIDESEATYESTLVSKEMAELRKEYYESREFMNAGEVTGVKAIATSAILQAIGQAIKTFAPATYPIPDVIVGGAGWSSPVALSIITGGAKIAPAAQAAGDILMIAGSLLNTAGSLSSTVAGYQRRQDDWDHQAQLAEKEIAQIEKQILAAETRVQIAQRELSNHSKQIEQSEEIKTYLRDKFTNQRLYSWMSGQISGLYFQAYQLAYDIAKQAEKAFQHELGTTDSSFIEFGYWDSRKKGLLAGERLYQSLKRMETAYHEKNRREYELSKQISLLFVDPRALVRLRETGSCFFDIPELLFDLDYPGHYMRRIKSISLTIPCVTGPYTSINAKLTLLGNRIRKNTRTAEGYEYANIDDERFAHNLQGGQSIAASSGQNDSGMFEFNFRDERYLPFERAGAISSWRLELPNDFRQFDYDTISDVIIHMNYTARDGGDLLKQSVVQSVNDNINNWADDVAATGEGLFQLVSLKHEFPTELHQFLNPAAGADSHSTSIKVTQALFPHFLRSKDVTVDSVRLLVKLDDAVQSIEISGRNMSLIKKGVAYDATSDSKSFALDPTVGNLPMTDSFEFGEAITPLLELELSVRSSELSLYPGSLKKGDLLDSSKLQDIMLLIRYTIS